jgi:hypothetical protein
LWPRARPLKDDDPALGLNDLLARISRSLRSGKQSVAQFFTRDLGCVAREKAAEVDTPIALAHVESLEDKDAKAFAAISDEEAVSSFVLKSPEERLPTLRTRVVMWAGASCPVCQHHIAILDHHGSGSLGDHKTGGSLLFHGARTTRFIMPRYFLFFISPITGNFSSSSFLSLRLAGDSRYWCRSCVEYY